jgi:hypothetical protein
MVSLSRDFLEGHLGFAISLAVVIACWTFLIFFGSMRKQVFRVAPLKSKGLQNLVEANNVDRIWRMHCMLFPESSVRRKAKLAAGAAAALFMLRFVLFFLGI